MADDKFEILGFDLPTIAFWTSVLAIGTAGFVVVNQFRTDQQRAAEDQAKKQQAYYRDYYRRAYDNNQQPQQPQPQAQLTPEQQHMQKYSSDFDRIWIPEGRANLQTNVIKPEYMHGTPSNMEPLPDSMDPDMMRANQQIGGTGAGDYYEPPQEYANEYDPSAPENIDYNEQTGEVRARRHGNESVFGQNVSAPQG